MATNGWTGREREKSLGGNKMEQEPEDGMGESSEEKGKERSSLLKAKDRILLLSTIFYC